MPATSAPLATSTLHGIALRVLGVFFIAVMSAVVHALGDDHPVGQIIFWRSAIAMIPIAIYAALRGNMRRTLTPQSPRAHLTRGVFGALSIVCAFVSVIYLPLANAQALTFLAPVLSLPLAACMLKERLTPPVVVAVLLGFSGVLAFLWDAFASPGPEALIGVATGLAFAVITAFLRIHVKTMTRTETPAAIAFWFSLISALVGLATLPFGWTAPTLDSLTLLIAAGLLGGLAYIAATEALARAPVTVVAPFDFTGLIWTAAIDLLVFAHLPTPLAWLGIALITSAALLVTLRAPRS